MTGSVANALRSTSKGKLVYKRDLDSFENEKNRSTSSFFSSIAKTLEKLAFREDTVKDEVDFKNSSKVSFLAKTDLFFENPKTEKTTKFKENNSIYLNQQLNQETIHLDEINQLNLYENEFKIKTENKINNLVLSLNHHFNEIDEETNIKLSEIRQNFFILKLKYLERYNNEWNNLYNQITSKTNNYDIDQSVKTKLDKVEQERLQKQKEIFKSRIKKLKEYYKEVETIYDKFNSKLKDKNVQDDKIESFKQIKLLKQRFELLLQKSTSENLNEIILHEAKQQLFDPILKLAENAGKELEQLLAKKPDIEKATEKENEKKIEKPAEKKVSKSKEEHDGFVSIEDRKFYIETRKFKIKIEESIKQFSEDNQFKDYRTALKGFIFTTVNQISSNSQKHVQDKLDRYTRLFSGQMVEYRGQPLSINEHKDALNYCIYHTANQFLVTGLKQVLASTKSAYLFAQVIVALCVKFQNFNKILLAFFFEMCPYSVPYYPIKDSDDDETVYKVTLGYSFKDGKIDDEETFLDKMRALMRLYGAIVQMNSLDCSLNLRTGWKWLASILNLDPIGSISAAVIHSFLSIVDSKLRQVYGKQFVKLIRFIKSVYIPKINELKLEKLQAKGQLEIYIDQLLKTF